MQFQAICSKGNKKLTLSISASDINEARNILHRQGYSIIEIHELIDSTVLQSGEFFYFDIENNGIVQTGKIQSNDIFKAYRKLVEDLKYNVRYIYHIPEMPEEQKMVITAKVKDGYNMFLASQGRDEQEVKVDKFAEETIELSPELLKELEKYNKLVLDTITKIQNLLIKNHEIITSEQKSVLEWMEIELTQVKWIKNTGRIRWVLEKSLSTIGTIEIEILKKSAIKEKAKFLQETNSLLKGIGSATKIETEEQKQQSIEYKLKWFFDRFSSKTSSRQEKLENKIDKQSFVYFKNQRELDIYKKTLSKNNTLMMKALFSLNFTLFRRLYLKRRLLVQNIQIISNRLNNRTVSYTQVVKGFSYYTEIFAKFFHSVTIYLVIGFFFYSLSYIFLQSLRSLEFISVDFNEKSTLFLTIFALFVMFLTFMRGWKTFFIFLFCFFCITFFLINNF